MKKQKNRVRPMLLSALIVLCSCSLQGNLSDENIVHETMPQIKVITTDLWWQFFPHLTTVGYQVEDIGLSEEEFALSVLAQDMTYDLVFLSTFQRFSTNIKNNGAFYPLNDIPGVVEYLDICYPYLKEAATDNNGNIWMLPVAVDIPVVVYHEANCAEAGLDFATAETVADVWDVLSHAGEAYGDDSPRFNFSFPIARDYSMLGYFTNNTSADTVEFRELADAIKGCMRGHRYDVGNPKMDAEDFLFTLTAPLLGSTVHAANKDSDYLRTASFFGTLEPAPAYVWFLYINPTSDNLEYTLEYISALAVNLSRRMEENPDTFLLQGVEMQLLSSLTVDSVTQTTENPDAFLLEGTDIVYAPSEYMNSLHTIYENAKVGFSVPFEIYDYDMIDYIHEIIDIETFIEGVDRKLAMYLNE